MDSNGNETNGVGVDLYEIMMTIKEHPIFEDIQDVELHFWKMFVVDALIGNTDRNNSNWGIVIKKDGSRELFDKNKLLSGLLKACQKRPVDAKVLADEIEAAIQATMKSEVSSNRIGELAMEKLKALDGVAYVRYASVHREFKDVDTFVREITELKTGDDGTK